MGNCVYVIELAGGAGPRRDPRIPWVYVGSSARDPEIRFAQHQRGYRSARLVKRYAIRLRPDLYEDLEPIRGSKAAVAAEQERARELAACGFVAHSDGVSYGKGDPLWQEWGERELSRVAGHVEAARLQLDEAAFEPLSAERCARLLRGELGFWVQDYLDPGDPPPAYGLFAHASLDALSAVVARATPA